MSMEIQLWMFVTRKNDESTIYSVLNRTEPIFNDFFFQDYHCKNQIASHFPAGWVSAVNIITIISIHRSCIVIHFIHKNNLQFFSETFLLCFAIKFQKKIQKRWIIICWQIALKIDEKFFYHLCHIVITIDLKWQ